MLLRASPIHNRRLQRIALALIGLGVLILAAAIALGCWRNVQAARAQEDYLQRVFLAVQGKPEQPPPFLTAGRQGMVYAPGQTALAFVEGFLPHEPLFVRLYSRTQGLLDAYQARADVRGQFAAARTLNLDKDSEIYTPPGGLWFQVEALSGSEQVFRFRLESDHQPEAAVTKGVYPPVTSPGTVVAFWCSRLLPDEVPSVIVAVDGQALRPGRIQIETYPIGPDGLLLGTLVVSLDDPTGEWRVFANHCQLDFPVRSTLDAVTVEQGVPHVDHTP
ncbi:MAG: hypothetical protein AB1894_07720 [Chloroflexota bacterium]